jgi:hypothetical protein
MEEAIGTLCGYSFLARRSNTEIEGEGEEEWYDIHRLVQLATRVWVEKCGDAAGVREEAVRQVVSVFPSDDYPNRAVWRAYLPHALRLLEEKQGCNIAERSELCLLVGRCLRVDSRIREAVRWLEESCFRRGALDEEGNRLASQHALALAYEADGQVKKAVELLEAVVRAQETLAARQPDRSTRSQSHT